jgi:signal transduction histidine kinase/PAS domain-containing protein
MTGDAIAWSLTIVVIAVAVAGAVWLRRRLDATTAAAEQAARAAGAERARIEEERRAIAEKAARLETELASERAGRLQLLGTLDILPVPVWRRDVDLRLVDCNLAYARAVEADRAVVIEGKRMLGGAQLEEQGRALAGLARAARTPQSDAHHVVIAGARRLIEFTEAALPGGGTVGIALDTTEREEAQAELQRLVKAHGEVLENLTTAIAIYGADTRLKFFNTAFAKLWKLDESWLRSEPDFGAVLELLREKRRLPEYADFRAFKQQRLRLFTTLLEPLEELTYIPDGTTLRSRISPHPLGGLFVTYEDVTDNLVLERSYNTLIAVQRETLDNLYEGVAVVGGDGRLKLTNPAYARIWHLPSESLSAEPHISEIVEESKGFFDYGEDWSGYKDRIIARMTDRAPRTGRLARTDGSVLDYACVPLPDGAILLSYVDVTDSIRVERALRERAEALETADRLKSEFISNVSYELRTPLNTIIGFAEILANQYFGELNTRQMEYCRGIIGSSERLLTIINDILDLASIEAGRMTLDREAVEPKALLDTVSGIMNEWARSQNLKLNVDCPPDLEPIQVDERRLKQALCNLISNAIKFTPPGGAITITGRVENETALFSVADTGIGIAAEDHERVFKEFERARRPETRRAGAGLGLSLVKRIVELHGGQVNMDSVPNRGTTVICVLPVHNTAAPS